MRDADHCWLEEGRGLWVETERKVKWTLEWTERWRQSFGRSLRQLNDEKLEELPWAAINKGDRRKEQFD